MAIRLVTKGDTGVPLTNSAAIFSTVTDSAGNYALNGIPNGYYALTPTLAGYGLALTSSLSSGTTADNFRINGADVRLDFSARPESDASGGVDGI